MTVLGTLVSLAAAGVLSFAYYKVAEMTTLLEESKSVMSNRPMTELEVIMQEAQQR